MIEHDTMAYLADQITIASAQIDEVSAGLAVMSGVRWPESTGAANDGSLSARVKGLLASVGKLHQAYRFVNDKK